MAYLRADYTLLISTSRKMLKRTRTEYTIKERQPSEYNFRTAVLLMYVVILFRFLSPYSAVLSAFCF